MEADAAQRTLFAMILKSHKTNTITTFCKFATKKSKVCKFNTNNNQLQSQHCCWLECRLLKRKHQTNTIIFLLRLPALRSFQSFSNFLLPCSQLKILEEAVEAVEELLFVSSSSKWCLVPGHWHDTHWNPLKCCWIFFFFPLFQMTRNP